MPQNIQIEEHSIVDAKLCEFFTHLSLFAWVSAQNSANIFNHMLLDSSSKSDKNISSEQVSCVFVLNTLLQDSAENDAPLILPDIGDKDKQMKQAMDLHNKWIIDEGQPQQMHTCKICKKFLPGDRFNNLHEF